MSRRGLFRSWAEARLGDHRNGDPFRFGRFGNIYIGVSAGARLARSRLSGLPVSLVCDYVRTAFQAFLFLRKMRVSRRGLNWGTTDVGLLKDIHL